MPEIYVEVDVIRRAGSGAERIADALALVKPSEQLLSVSNACRDGLTAGVASNLASEFDRMFVNGAKDVNDLADFLPAAADNYDRAEEANMDGGN